MKKNGIILIAKEEIVRINKKIENGKLVREGQLDFIVSKLKSKRLKGDLKKDLASLAGILWFEIITTHPFLDGNKRTATGSMLYFLEQNNFVLNAKENNLIYLSLKIANKDISQQKIIEWIFEKLEVKK